MSGRRGRTLAALAGGLLLAGLLGLLLLPGGDRGTEPPPDPGGAARRVPAEPGPRPEEPRIAAAPAAAPRAAPVAAKRKPKPYALPVEAALEDGTPVQGITFLVMMRGESGAPEVSLEPDALFQEGTDAGGKCTLRWGEETEEFLLLVIGRRDEVVAVGNGALLGLDTSGEIVLAAPGPGPLRLTMRRRAGIGSLFLLDAGTGEPIVGRMWISRIRFSDGNLLQGPGGRIGEQAVRLPLELPALPRRDIYPVDERVLEVAVEGYETAELRLAEFRGPNPLRLEPKIPSVVGEIVVPGMETNARRLLAALARMGPVPPAEPGATAPLGWPHAVPRVPGPFAIHDLPDGTWVLRLAAVTPDGVRWARRTFEKSGGTVHLGTIEVSGWAGIRARLLDPEGTPVAGRSFQFAMAEEAPLSKPLFFRPDPRPPQRVPGRAEGEIVLVGTVEFVAIEGFQAWVVGTGPDGWCEVPDLAPGTRYRVVFHGRKEVTAEVTTPETNGGMVEVELRLPEGAEEEPAVEGDGFAIPVKEE